MSDTNKDADQPLDPKEAMRQALEAKKAASHGGGTGSAGGSKGKVSGTQGPQGGKRTTFRRKAGG